MYGSLPDKSGGSLLQLREKVSILVSMSCLHLEIMIEAFSPCPFHLLRYTMHT